MIAFQSEIEHQVKGRFYIPKCNYYNFLKEPLLVHGCIKEVELARCSAYAVEGQRGKSDFLKKGSSWKAGVEIRCHI